MAAGIHATQQGEGSGRPRPLTEMEKLQRDFDRYKAGESGRREAALEDYRGEKRQQLTDEFGGYKSRFKEMEDLELLYQDLLDLYSPQCLLLG